MTQVTLDKAIAEELITSKIQLLQQFIDEILHRWNEPSTKDFLERARTGEIVNAEEDAVELRQLMLDYQKYRDLLTQL
jgi:hypothetical protein